MGKQTLTGGDAKVGKLSAKGNISTASGSVTANGFASTLGVSAGSQGFTVSSVSWRVYRVPVSAGTTAERTYGLAFSNGDVIKDVYLDVSVGESTAATKTIDIGLLSSETNGDADGLLDGVSTASTALAGPVQGSTAISAAARTRGVLLLDGSAASSDLNRKYHIISGTNARTLASTVAAAHTELVADIVVEVLSIR